jgi:hypothetical protein
MTPRDIKDFHDNYLPRATEVWIKAEKDIKNMPVGRSGMWHRVLGTCAKVHSHRSKRVSTLHGEILGFAYEEIFGAKVDGVWYTEPGFIPERFNDSHMGHWIKQGNNKKWNRIRFPETFNTYRPIAYSIECPNLPLSEFLYPDMAKRTFGTTTLRMSGSTPNQFNFPKSVLIFRDIKPGMWVKLKENPCKDGRHKSWDKFYGTWQQVESINPIIFKGYDWYENEIEAISEHAPMDMHEHVAHVIFNGQITEQKEKNMNINEDSLKKLQEFDPANLAKAKAKVEEDLATKQQVEAGNAYIAILNELEQLNIDLKRMNDRKDFLEKAKASFNKQ